MKSFELENSFFYFFKKNGYIKFNEIPLVPKNDNTLLFTNSGMVQFKNVFLGLEKNFYDKIITAQTCVRVGGKHNDFKNIGLSPHHNTSFKMLGNFGFKNVSKSYVISEAWNFLIKELKLDVDRLHISVHKNDYETLNIWKNYINISDTKIFLGSDDSNFWSMDKTGPCGYCTEIFYNIDDKIENLLEIWNLVFIQFDQTNNELLKLKNIFLDTGLGLERICSIMQKTFNNFKTDIYIPLLKTLCNSFKIDNDFNKSINIIVDHMKTVTLLLNENIIPGNGKREYILKKLIRRVIIEKNNLNIKLGLFNIDNDFFYLIKKDINVSFIKEVLKSEEDKFKLSLNLSKTFFNKMLQRKTILNNKDLFFLYDTYGMPLDLIKSLSKKHNIDFNLNEFNKELDNQIEKNKLNNFTNDLILDLLKDKQDTIFIGYNKKILRTKILHIISDNQIVFELKEGQRGLLILEHTCFYSEKGGQIGDSGKIKNFNNIFIVDDTKEFNNVYLHYGVISHGILRTNDDVILFVDKIKRKYCSNNHSATHLLHAVLKSVLGTHVNQMGSLITSDYFRFDFTHFSSLTKDELIRVEFLINKYISMQLDIITDVQFDSIADKFIRTVSVGHNISKELCAGTHAKNTKDLFLFKIIKEYGIGSNVRRIEAMTGYKIINNFKINDELLNNIVILANCNKNVLLDNLKKILNKNIFLEKENIKLNLELFKKDISDQKNINFIKNISVVILLKDIKFMNIISKILTELNNSILILFFVVDKNLKININFSKNLFQNIGALDIIIHLKQYVVIRGGGTKYIANGIISMTENILIEDISKIILAYLNEKLKLQEDKNVNFN